MKKIFTLLTMALLAIGAQAQKISFSADDIASAGEWSQGKEFSNGDFKITLVDDQKKMAIDENKAYFGTADSYEKFTHRLKSGAKSQGTGKLCQISVTIPFNGDLKVYARTGSNSATDRNLVISQNGESLYNEIIQESQAISVEMEENINADNNPTGSTKVYPIVTVKVTAGTALITFPTGSMNFYGFEFVSDGTTVIPAEPHAATVWDFTKTTVELLNPAYWTEDANTSGRYTYGTEIASDTYRDLGELGCSEGLGLLVGRSGNKLAANSIRVDVGKQIQINASNGVYKITDLAKDDVVRIHYKSASDEARKFTVTNGDVTELEAPANSAEDAEKKATITVAADGDLLLTQSKAINVYVITVNAELPEATGIRTINVETVSNGAIYNLSGQRVDENYRGVVIKNGKKQIQK
jgi:hypothetical protein